jgi:hypothetical protein
LPSLSLRQNIIYARTLYERGTFGKIVFDTPLKLLGKFWVGAKFAQKRNWRGKEFCFFFLLRLKRQTKAESEGLSFCY